MHPIAEDALGHLQTLIRINTTNPPGGELPAARYVSACLQREGIPCNVLEAAPGRGSAIARLSGNGSAGGPLLLMSHLDVVPAEAEHWDHPPFAAEIADGYVWGRGAVDTKQLTAMQMAILVALRRQNLPLKRDVVLAATADEETGGEKGMGWLVARHYELIDCEYAINEGGGFGFAFNGHPFYLCQTGEKGICWMRLRARGSPGHGALPHRNNAVVKLTRTLQSLSNAALPQHRTRTVEELMRQLGRASGFPRSVLLRLALDPRLEETILSRLGSRSELAAVLHATLHNTLCPTVLRAGTKTNVIPSEATADVDGRLVPGQSRDDLLREMQPHLGEDIAVEWLSLSRPYESDPASPLFDLFQSVLSEYDQGSTVLPFIVPGGTDGRFLAERGVKVYGFSPAKEEPGWRVLDQAHAANERLSLANLEFGTRVLYDVVTRFCA
jgi:acetylornithine deacetylase/succinyl-diaminopimelate desuccinylase-like protein